MKDPCAAASDRLTVERNCEAAEMVSDPMRAPVQRYETNGVEVIRSLSKKFATERVHHEHGQAGRGPHQARRGCCHGGS